MILVISNNRRLEIKNAVVSVLQHANLPTLPVKIGSIIKSYHNIKLITYSSQIKKYNITYDELINISETKDSFVVYCKSKDKYSIYYNDTDNGIVSSNRVYWNLAHELGHVVLRHHQKCNREKLFRDNIDNVTYRFIEDEANYFAQLLLVPHVVLAAFKITSYLSLKNLCRISDSASRRRFRDFTIWKTHIDADDKYDNLIFHFYYKYMFKRKCKKCDCEILQRKGKFCPICGEKNVLQHGGELKMIYRLLDTHENGKLMVCPTCKNEETNIEGNYCHICGAYIINTCTSPNCCNLLPSNARYCSICGRKSTFYENGFLNEWQQERNNFYQEDNYLSIPKGIIDELPFQ